MGGWISGSDDHGAGRPHAGVRPNRLRHSHGHTELQRAVRERLPAAVPSLVTDQNETLISDEIVSEVAHGKRFWLLERGQRVAQSE